METCKNTDLSAYFIFSLEAYLYLEKMIKKVAEMQTHRKHRRVSFQIIATSNPAQAEEKQNEV